MVVDCDVIIETGMCRALSAFVEENLDTRANNLSNHPAKGYVGESVNDNVLFHASTDIYEPLA